MCIFAFAVAVAVYLFSHFLIKTNPALSTNF